MCSAVLHHIQQRFIGIAWNILYSTVLYCIVLYCIVLYCIVLYCIVLYCIVLYSTVQYCTVLYCTVLYCTVLYCTVLHYAILYYIMWLTGLNWIRSNRTPCNVLILFPYHPQTYSSASDILDLNHYKLWYKVQNDRLHQEKIRAKLVLKSSKKEEIGIERDLFRREKSTFSSTNFDINQETLFCTQFVGRYVRDISAVM